MESVAVELAREAREEFERGVGEMRVYVAHQVALEAACVVATSQGEFDLLRDAVEALLLADL